METQPNRKTNKKILIVFGVLFGIFFLFVIAGSFVSDAVDESQPTDPKADSIAARNQTIEKQFSGWDGSHVNLTKYIKKNMNDPDSYEHVETKYWDMTDHLVVRTEFRGKNGFGAVVIQAMKAKVGLNGDVIEIIEVD